MVTIQSLAASHAPAGLRLSSQAGWNQTLSDWRLMLVLGTAYGAFDSDELIATSLYLSYPPIAWTGMVLVDERWRRRGLATQLMKKCLDEIDAAGQIAMLDATSAGAEVYRRLGFRELVGISRIEGRLPPNATDKANRTEVIRRADLTAVAALDRDSFAGDRTRLLERLAAPNRSLCLRDASGRVAAFALTRAGRLTAQIGPVIAPSPDDALLLIHTLSDGLNDAILLDIPHPHRGLSERLQQYGFEEKRSFVRMIRGQIPPVSLPFAIAGPALG